MNKDIAYELAMLIEFLKCNGGTFILRKDGTWIAKIDDYDYESSFGEFGVSNLRGAYCDLYGYLRRKN